MLALADCSMVSACAFIVLEYSLISWLFLAISSTSSLTVSVLLLMVPALLATSCMVAESSSVSAERSDALLLEVCTLPITSPTTLNIEVELLVIIVKISCRSSINELIPELSAPISSSDSTVILLVRSPSLLLIPSMIS